MCAEHALDITAKVRAQYEDYPYPQRIPEDERHRLMDNKLDAMDAVNHYCFGGMRDYRKGFKVLVAGGGTGDSLIFLAEQLRDHPQCEITYVDLSSASMAIAKERARIRGLENIRWIQGSLLDLATLAPGPFDYINCSGVLHHLPDPSAGLASLAGVLSESGAIGIMVYATYGRSGVYQMQEMLRRLHGDDTTPIETRIADTWHILKHLPNSNTFIRDADRWMNELQRARDIAIYDIFLHAQDRAYTVPELYDWVENEGLHLVDFVGGGTVLGKASYDPLSFIADADLAKRVQLLPLREQQAIAELMVGIMRKHIVYLSKSPVSPVTLETAHSEDMIPALSLRLDPSLYAEIRTLSPSSPPPQALVVAGKSLIPEGGEALLRHLNGNTPLSALYAKAGADTSHPLTQAQARALFAECYARFFNYDMMYFRGADIPAFTAASSLQKRAFSHG